MNAAPQDVEKLSSAIANCDGTSLSMAETMQDNLGGQLTILKSQLEELAISFRRNSDACHQINRNENSGIY